MPRMADPQEERAHEGELTRMAFLSCSASALSWSSSFILAKCVDGWRRLRQGHGIVVRPSLGPLHRPMLDHPGLPLPPSLLATTDRRPAGECRPTDRATDRPAFSTCCSRRPIGAFSLHSRRRSRWRCCSRGCSAQPPPPSPPRLGRRRRCWRRRHSSHGALARGKRGPRGEGGTGGNGGGGGGRGGDVS